MALEQKLSLRLSQKLVMTPSLQQAIKLLQMTRMELEGVLTQELVENPILEEGSETREEESEKSAEEQEKETEKAEEDPFDEIDFEAYFGEYSEGSSHASIREHREEYRFETNLTQEPDLYDHLSGQLHMCNCRPAIRRVAEMIIGNLDPEGFLLASVIELCELSQSEYDPSRPESQPEAHSAREDNTETGPPVEAAKEASEPTGEATGEATAAVFSDSIDAQTQDDGLVDIATAQLAATLIGMRMDEEATSDAPPSGAVLVHDDQSAAPRMVSVWADEPAVPVEQLSASKAIATPAVQPAETAQEATDENADEGADGDVVELEARDLFPAELVDEVEEALALVRSFDPPGVGHYTLRESLLAQLDASEEAQQAEPSEPFVLARRMVDEDWKAFLRRQFPALAKKYGVDLQQLKPAVETVSSLETRPGRRFNSEQARYIEPDVAVQRVGGEYVILLNDDGLPRLRVSRAYRQMLRKMKAEGNHSDAQSFIKEKMRSAIWLIKSLDQRQRTIYKVARSIVDQQRDFFDHGIEHLRPMVLRDVAEDIEMHESTVSRVVSNKYINTPRGLLPLKFFFHSGIDREYGENISSLTVKRKLERLIQEEDPKKPLSDSELMRILKREGIQIARRTVAKYRDELAIPSSTERKQIF